MAASRHQPLEAAHSLSVELARIVAQAMPSPPPKAEIDQRLSEILPGLILDLVGKGARRDPITRLENLRNAALKVRTDLGEFRSKFARAMDAGLWDYAIGVALDDIAEPPGGDAPTLDHLLAQINWRIDATLAVIHAGRAREKLVRAQHRKPGPHSRHLVDDFLLGLADLWESLTGARPTVVSNSRESYRGLFLDFSQAVAVHVRALERSAKTTVTLGLPANRNALGRRLVPLLKRRGN